MRKAWSPTPRSPARPSSRASSNAANAELAKLDDGLNVRSSTLAPSPLARMEKIPWTIMPTSAPHPRGYQCGRTMQKPLAANDEVSRRWTALKIVVGPSSGGLENAARTGAGIGESRRARCARRSRLI